MKFCCFDYFHSKDSPKSVSLTLESTSTFVQVVSSEVYPLDCAL